MIVEIVFFDLPEGTTRDDRAALCRTTARN